MSPFRYCPHCKAPDPAFEEGKRLRCLHCGYVYYHNTAAAVGALIRSDDRILFIRRGRNPGYGLLDLPGGFVDPGETLEEALSRECLEEIGEEPVRLTYCCSQSNRYEFAGILYTTADVFFYADLAKPLTSDDDLRRFACDPSEVLSLHLLDPRHIAPDELAFPSLMRLHAKLIST